MFINFDFTCEYRVLSNTYLMGQGGVLFLVVSLFAVGSFWKKRSKRGILRI
jgi:hypothetical protein